MPSSCVSAKAQPPSDTQSSCLCASGMAWLELPRPRSALPVGYVSALLRPISGWDANPPVFLPHSTCGVAVSTALFSGVCAEEICTSALWMKPCPFIRFWTCWDPSRGHRTGEGDRVRFRWQLGSTRGTFWALFLIAYPCVPRRAHGMGVCVVLIVCGHLGLLLPGSNNQSQDQLIFF